MDAEEFRRRYAEGERGFLDGELVGADLRGVNLRGACLPEADLGGADLRGANLRRADLSGAALDGADLSGADLGGADLSESILLEADLSGAELRGANLRGAKYNNTTKWPDGFDFAQAGAIGPNSDLRGADLREANLNRVNLEGADLREASLEGANIRGVRCDRSTKWPDGFGFAHAEAMGSDSSLRGASLQALRSTYSVKKEARAPLTVLVDQRLQRIELCQEENSTLVILRNDVLSRVRKLLPTQISLLIFNLGIPSDLLPSENAPRVERCIKLIEYMEQSEDGLSRLQDEIEKVLAFKA